MANLYDLLQGLIDTDRGIISKLKSRMEEFENEVNDKFDELNNSVTNVNTKVERGSGTYGILDINSPDIISDGVRVSDTNASKGECYYKLSSSSSTYCLYSCTFADVNFGSYAICMRLKLNVKTTSSIIRLNVYSGSSLILQKDFSGSLFATNTDYYNIYTTFDYNGNNTTDKALKIEVQTLNVDGIGVFFDYAYINLIMPAVFL